MPIPKVELPTLRAYLGSIACRATTSTSTNRGLASLQGAATESDTDVQTVVNAIVTSLDAQGAEPPGGTSTYLRADGNWTSPGPSVAVQTGTAPSAMAARRWQVQVSRTGGGDAVTFTLPAAPEAGDIVEAINEDTTGSHTVTLARNALKIDGANSDLVMANNVRWTRLVYVDATTGWATAGSLTY